ncbi:hypothetical protein D3C87_1374140 [compost metagenome]
MAVREQLDQAARAHAAHAHHLEGDVLGGEVREQFAAIGGQRGDVIAEAPGNHFGADVGLEPVVVLGEQRLLAAHMEEGRRGVQDAPAVPLALAQLRQQRLMRPAGGALHRAADLLLGHRVERLGQQAVERNAVVPGFQHAHFRIHGHAVTVAVDHFAHHVVGDGLAVAQVARGHHHTGGQPLQVPLPWAGAGLVEIVQIEQQRALGRSKPAEIREVAVAADLDGHARGWRAGKVVRLDDRAASEKCERGLDHAPVAQGHQALHPASAAGLEQRYRVPVHIADRRVRAPRHQLAQRLAAGAPFVQIRHMFQNASMPSAGKTL